MIENKLITTRDQILEKLSAILKDFAEEIHILGSVARGEADAYSDLDLWITISDEKFDEIKRLRFEYFALAGEIVHYCEPPQNAPKDGVHTAVIFRHENILTMVDIYLCPLRTSFITKESKKIFGLDLRLGEMRLNPQKIEVGEDYRIDFFLCFVFNSIKKISRKEVSPLSSLLFEYKNLQNKYGLEIDALPEASSNQEMLNIIMKNISKVSNERQNKALEIITMFGGEILSLVK